MNLTVLTCVLKISVCNNSLGDELPSGETELAQFITQVRVGGALQQPIKSAYFCVHPIKNQDFVSMPFNTIQIFFFFCVFFFCFSFVSQRAKKIKLVSVG